MRLASLTPEIQQKLRALCPPAASVVNPIDVLGDAPADRYALAIQAALSDPMSDRAGGVDAANRHADSRDGAAAGRAVSQRAA